jgi:hypothetical protein
MSLGDCSLKLAENRLGVVRVDTEAKVIQSEPLPRLRRVQTKEAALKPQLTEVFPLIANRESREPLVKGF